MKRKMLMGILAGLAVAVTVPSAGALAYSEVTAGDLSDTETETEAAEEDPGQDTQPGTQETAAAPSVQTGWVNDENGWKYYLSDGTQAVSSFQQVDGKWYYFDDSGYMVTGWANVDGTYYYMDGSGVMQAGKWIKDNDKWYYLNDDGSMAVNSWEELAGYWFYCGADGAMLQSTWIDIDGKSYYLQDDGTMAADTVIEGYEIGADGVAEKKNLNIGFDHRGTGGKEFAVITASDDQGNTVWRHQTGKYLLDDSQETNEVSAIGVSESFYYYVEGGTVVCLDVNDGSIQWINSDFGGALTSTSAFMGSQAIYLGGYNGPDFYAVTYRGKTLQTIDTLEDGFTHPQNITNDGDYVYEDLTDENGNTVNFTIYLPNYSVSRTDSDE